MRSMVKDVISLDDVHRGRRSATLPLGTGMGARKVYRAVVCIFENVVFATRGLANMHLHGIAVSDLAVLTAFVEPAEALLSLDPPTPAIFLRLGVRGSFGWVHMGPSASHMARKMARLTWWASQRTVDDIEAELSKGRIVVVIYGLQSVINSLAASIKSLPVLRVESHDIPGWVRP